MFNTITKRDGSTVSFDQDKIIVAMRKAFAEEQVAVDETILQQMADRVSAKMEEMLPDGQSPTVEKVQDFVEETLMERGYFRVAKAYILYRFRQSEERKEEVSTKIKENKLTIATGAGTAKVFSLDTLHEYIARFTDGYENEIDIPAVVAQIESEIYDGISTKELAKVVTLVLRSMIEIDPAYSAVAARQLVARVAEEVTGEDVSTLPTDEYNKKYRAALGTNIKRGIELKLYDERIGSFDFEKLAAAIKPERDDLFRYLGVETLNDRYFVREQGGPILETPQMMWMRIAMGVAMEEEQKDDRAIEFYNIMSTLRFVPSTPTLFHAGTPHPQLSSCYLNMVEDDLSHIFKVYKDNAFMSKYAGGVGTSWSHLRGTGALIKPLGINSQGTIPFLKIANDVTVAINRSGRRRGATCVYMENWHYDFEDFLELRKATGDERRRAHDMNTASWISDLFMKRVRDDGEWTLLSPDECPELTETFGKEFETIYTEYEKKAANGELKLFKKLKARDLWKKHVSMLFETGHPWVTFKDPSNIRSPQDHAGVVHNSNLCTEITLNNSREETAVCNLGSVHFHTHIKADGQFDFEKARETTTIAMRMLDNVIDINFYPTAETRVSNMRHRPVGLGISGFQDALYGQGIAFDSEACVEFADASMEVISHAAIHASAMLAKERGAYESFKGSKWDRGLLPQDTVAILEEERGLSTGQTAAGALDWEPVRAAIKEYGMRNSNCMAIAPTATTANIAGSIPAIEPIYKNIYVKANISGDFIIVNRHLVQALKERGLWSQDMLKQLKYHDGSVRDIVEIPEDMKTLYKETFDIDMRWIIRAAAARGKWIDQSQSLNIFYSGASGKEIGDLYMYAWEMGLKTTYYLRTLGASQVEKSTVAEAGTQTRASGGVGAAPAAVAAAATTTSTAVPSPMPTPSPVTSTSIDAEKVAVAAPEKTVQEAVETVVAAAKKPTGKLYVAEESVCTSCEG